MSGRTCHVYLDHYSTTVYYRDQADGIPSDEVSEGSEDEKSVLYAEVPLRGILKNPLSGNVRCR